MGDPIGVLRRNGILATPQRIAVARYVLATTSHPTADQVWQRVRRRCPALSRATVYNTLNLLVRRGLLKPRAFSEGVVRFDPHVGRHHHFIDERTGVVYNVPWEAVSVSGERALGEFEVREYHVVMRGRLRRP